MEHALLRFEVEVMVEHNLEYVMDCCCMSIHVGACCNPYVIHVHLYSGPLEFVFENDISEDIVHHGLEHHQGISKSKVHNSGFKESIPCFESHFPFISFLYVYVVIPPSDVQFCVDMGVTEVSYEV